MKRASILLVGILSGIALATFPNIALANTIRTIKTSQVSGENAQLQTVQVWPGHGVSISFFKTEETIKRIWLDDPSRFLIDVDGCLEGLSRSNCRNPGAGMVHIRRINDVKIPGMPKATNGAHLTIVTESQQGTRSHYHFRIVAGGGTPQYSSLEIVSDRQETQQQQLPKPQPNATAIANSSLLARGMQVALANNWIETDSPLWQKLNIFIENLQSGKHDMTTAATNAGVSMRLVRRLIQLGTPAPKQHLPKVPPTTSPYFTTNTSQ